MPEPSPLTLQFLDWVAGGRRSRADLMATWQSSCPRLSIWEDALIAGLVRSDGSILGIPNAEPGTYTFLVKVADEGGRQDVRGLSIRLQPDFAASQSSGGCSSAAGLSSAALGVLAGLFLMRRRRA